MPFLTRPPSVHIKKRYFWRKQWWRLTGTLVFKDANGKLWEVPTKYRHDFASIPRIFWPLLPKRGNYDLPAVLHDYTHDDKLFYEAMMDEDVKPDWVAGLMYQVVAMDGSGREAYEEEKEERASFGSDSILGD